ncbi:NUDIX hydrolase [Desulfopila sp. IMCC35008]|uniref:NUDIX hydrolase n=1 Tax=Desulfopila sp. IMCC35008 TaxID=2653858 RepID=UPI0013CFEB01|nr:NUDIX hydrolase [Desulfopila sp. IMCC35008]
MKYCSNCGNRVSSLVPDGDNRPRMVCLKCHTVFYHNPKMVVGAIPVWEGKILLCRRAIDPSRGKWTLPAGYLENGETLAECAIRETEEEAGATIVNLIPYAVVNLPHINQVYFMFRSNLLDGTYQAGDESLEVSLVRPDEVPWDDLAFTSIQQVLRMYCRDLSSERWTFHMHDIDSHR